MGLFSSNRDYYRQEPGWGTSQYVFGQPRHLTFQPQPHWGGREFYNAHSGDLDYSMYDHARSSTALMGVGVREAKYYHRKAYAIEGELSRMMPEEIGHAAAYEIYRIWKHQGSLRDPLSASERKAEALAGMAVAEAKRLLEYTGRMWTGNALYIVGDAAAATASLIYEQAIEKQFIDISSGRHGRSRRSSMSTGYGQPVAPPMMGHSGLAGSIDPYAMDDYDDYHHRGRSRSRSLFGRPRSRSRGSSIIYPGEMQMPMGGSAYGAPMPAYGASPSYVDPMTMGGGGSSYVGGTSPYVGGAAMTAAAGSTPYPRTNYMAPSHTGYAQPQPMVVVEPSRRHRHHHHHHRHHSRPRSVDVGYGYRY